jgi:hypothetical protein
VLTEADEADILTLIDGPAQAHIAAWLESAPVFEHEVVKRMLREVVARLIALRESRATGVGGGGAVGTIGARDATGGVETGAKWSGAASAV